MQSLSLEFITDIIGKAKFINLYFDGTPTLGTNIRLFIIFASFIISLNIKNKGHRSVLGVGIAVDGEESYMILMIEYEKERKQKISLHTL